MALLTKEMQDRVVAALQDEGLVDPAKLAEIRSKTEAAKQPILPALVEQK